MAFARYVSVAEAQHGRKRQGRKAGKHKLKGQEKETAGKVVGKLRTGFLFFIPYVFVGCAIRQLARMLWRMTSAGPTRMDARSKRHLQGAIRPFFRVQKRLVSLELIDAFVSSIIDLGGNTGIARIKVTPLVGKIQYRPMTEPRN